ncbi:MAG: HupE/UreJ family protein [Bacteroidetes bacterium]|nr:HupE/UreJ family protein [Bacteroidota bacterium]
MKKLSLLLLLFIPLLGWSHGVPESTINAMADASLIDFIFFGAEHMLTGYDHILFLIGVVFFLTNFLDIFKFITAFTVAHCIVLIFATFYGITANAYLIDAVIAFSVIYKGFENLDGFKKWFSINAPNLVLMVFVFGLIHGFGLSTKLQEVAAATSIHLSLSQILCFNLGVEVGQIAVLIIVFPLLSMVRGKLFDKVSNWLLVLAGVLLLIYQLNGFFTDKGNHQHPVKEPIEHFELDHHEHSHDELPHQNVVKDSVEHHEHDHHEHSHGDGHSHSH